MLYVHVLFASVKTDVPLPEDGTSSTTTADPTLPVLQVLLHSYTCTPVHLLAKTPEPSHDYIAVSIVCTTTVKG